MAQDQIRRLLKMTNYRKYNGGVSNSALVHIAERWCAV